MKEKKFIEDLQKSLETPRDIPFDDANWKKLAAKLNNTKSLQLQTQNIPKKHKNTPKMPKRNFF